MDVLLVENDAAVREQIAEALTEAGLDVAELPDPASALALPSAAGAPSVLVTNIDLGPGMNGVALFVAAQRRWPALGVIYLSDRPRGRIGHLVGAHDRVLPLPADARLLLQMIETMRASFRAH